MFRPLLLLSTLLALPACAGDDKSDEDDDGSSEADADTDTDVGSSGCGKAAAHEAGGVQVSFDAGVDADGERGFWLSLPEDYDPDSPSALVIGYAGTNWVGEQIQPYLDLEGDGASDEIFVYPDPLWRDFPGWGNYGGWTLGPYGDNAEGEQDLAFTNALLDLMEEDYCIDRDRVFLTGHSWGGDMAAVGACFLGDRVTAAVPVAANRPYWFEDGGSTISCEGEAAVWTFFGIADDHFTWQSYDGEFGDEQDAFWQEEHGCSGETEALDLGGSADECIAATGCSVDTRYCLYGPSTGHQVPGFYSSATMDWFRSF